MEDSGNCCNVWNISRYFPNFCEIRWLAPRLKCDDDGAELPTTAQGALNMTDWWCWSGVFRGWIALSSYCVLFFHSRDVSTKRPQLSVSQRLYWAKQLSNILNLRRTKMTRQSHVKNSSNPLIRSSFEKCRTSLPPLPYFPPLSTPLTLCDSLPSALPRQNYRGLLVVKSVFLQPGISTGPHSVGTLHSLCLPYNSHAHVRACCLHCHAQNQPWWNIVSLLTAQLPILPTYFLTKAKWTTANKSFTHITAQMKLGGMRCWGRFVQRQQGGEVNVIYTNSI